MSPESFHRQTSLMSPPSAGSMLVKLAPVAASHTLMMRRSEVRILVPAPDQRQQELKHAPDATSRQPHTSEPTLCALTGQTQQAPNVHAPRA